MTIDFSQFIHACDALPPRGIQFSVISLRDGGAKKIFRYAIELKRFFC